MNLSELYRTASIIDLSHEIMQDVIDMAKITKRWKYRPVKTHRGNMRRIGMIIGFTHKIYVQTLRIRMLKSQAARGLATIGFPCGTEVEPVWDYRKGDIILGRPLDFRSPDGMNCSGIMVDDLIQVPDSVFNKLNKKNDNTKN